MTSSQSSEPAPGWVGGFAESYPAFAYPDPDLSSLPLLDNMANIPKIKRQQAVKWPEFSWETNPGDPGSRCFQMFAQDISRLGYDEVGRVWSIICPQQGVVLSDVAALNVEVTVTGQRGWANETDQLMAADMGVEGKIWFSPSSHQHLIVRGLWDLFAAESLPFPSTKKDAIRVTTHQVGDSDHPLFALRSGQTAAFEPPDFAKHPEAWDVSNLSVEIGPIVQHEHHAVNTFNAKILDIFNIGSGNMLKAGNVLTWDVWFTAPELVDTTEWANHAEKWRHSIDADHGRSPDGSISSPAKFSDGGAFKPAKDLEEELADVLDAIRSLL